MARGRKPTPTSVLMIRGSKYGHSRSDEPQAPAPDDLPEPPAWYDETARAKWAELVPLLTEMRVLTVADLDHVRAYCAAFSRWNRAEAKLREGGDVVTHVNGVDGVSHWLRVAQAALERMDKSGAELGLSPVARTRIRALPTAADASKARFFEAPEPMRGPGDAVAGPSPVFPGGRSAEADKVHTYYTVIRRLLSPAGRVSIARARRGRGGELARRGNAWAGGG